MTQSEYLAVPENYRGVWTTERWDIPDWENLRKKYMGKRTLMVYDKGTCLLVEGLSLEIVDDNEDAQVDPWEITNGAKGYNTTARHVVYVGGVAADGKTPVDTRTLAQRKAMETYVKDFHRHFPDVEIVGHNQLAAKACPSFDVRAWLKSIGINR